jgi:hypothetical protein
MGSMGNSETFDRTALREMQRCLRNPGTELIEIGDC